MNKGKKIRLSNVYSEKYIVANISALDNNVPKVMEYEACVPYRQVNKRYVTS